MESMLKGLLVGGGLIVAIGAQNAFVLRQGLRREHGWLVALLCSGSDVLLIAAGVAGLAPLLQANGTLLELARWGGVVWLVWQAALALRRAWHPVGLSASASTGPAAAATGPMANGAIRVALATLAVTWLNPHVYLDTLVMLGLIGAQQSAPALFVFGAGLASVTWFCSLTFAGQRLAPRLRDPRWWRAIDLGVAVMLAWVAWRLIADPL